MESEGFEVRCPSGLVGMARSLRVADIKMLSSKQSKNKDMTSRLISNVWLKTLDPGIYPEQIARVEGPVDWNQALLGDRAYMVYQARRLTHGDDFYFDVNCSFCRNRISCKVDLGEVEPDTLSKEAVEMIEREGINNALFETTLPKAKRSVKFKLFRGSDQAIVQKAMKESQETGDGEGGVSGLLARLVWIEGCNEPSSRRKFVENLELSDAEFLREQWEYHDINIQDTVEVECQSCGAILEVFIPTDARFFSTRSARPKKISVVN